jgi:predicted lipoprotein
MSASTNTQPSRAEVIANLLTHTGPNVVEPALMIFAEQARLLHEAVQVWRSEQDETSLETAQQQWRTTMLSWQYLETMQFGPAASVYHSVNGMDFRDEIYSWPMVNACRIDVEVVEAEWNNEEYFTNNLVNIYGMDAIEYLLFSDSPDNFCPDQIAINKDGSWDALGERGLARNRADMASTLAGHVVDVSRTLYEEWASEYSATLAERAQTIEAEDDLDEMFGALYYLRQYTLKVKLCQPLGLSSCAADRYGAEHAYSGLPLAAIHMNLVGTRALFTGQFGPGLDDLLVWADQEDLLDTFLSEMDEAIEAAAALKAVEAVQPGDERMVSLHKDVEDVINLLFGDIATVLMVEVPIFDHGHGD